MVIWSFFNTVKEYFNDKTINLLHVDSVKEALWKIQIANYCFLILVISVFEDITPKTIIEIRKRNPVPILVFLENASNSDKILALKSGADNVVTQSDTIEMLFAQMETLFRRCTELNHIIPSNSDFICYDKLMLDTGRRVVFIDGEEIYLPYKEYEILLYMLKNRCRTLTFKQIYETIWKDYYFEDKSIVFYHIGQLRRLLGSGWIENVHGVGYRLCDRTEKYKEFREKEIIKMTLCLLVAMLKRHYWMTKIWRNMVLNGS